MQRTATVLATGFTPLRDRGREWEARLSMIREAERFLYASTYYVGPDSYGFGFLEALALAALRGVDCVLVVDRFGQRLGASAWTPGQHEAVSGAIAAAERAGVRVAWTEAGSPVRKLVGGGHHVKIQLSEAGRAIFGSSNLSRHSFERWGELSAVLQGPVVQTLLDALVAVVPELGVRTVASAPGPSIALDWWWCDPSDDPATLSPVVGGGANPITDELVRAVGGAQTSVAVSSFYFKPMPELREAFVQAARRGVAVEVFHSGADALSGPELSWLAAAQDYPALLEAGVVVHEVPRGEHSKTVLVDGRWASFGSYNLDNAAHDVVAEAMLSSEAAPVVQAVAGVFDELRGRSEVRRVRGDFREGWGIRRRVKARLLRPVRRWF